MSSGLFNRGLSALVATLGILLAAPVFAESKLFDPERDLAPLNAVDQQDTAPAASEPVPAAAETAEETTPEAATPASGSEEPKPENTLPEDYASGVLDSSTLGEATEQHLPADTNFKVWKQDFQVNDEPQFETRQVMSKKAETKKLTGLVPPILFKSGKADIPEDYVEKFRKILRDMGDRVNVRLHFIGHTDNVPLFGKLKEQYGDNMKLSEERAGTTAEFFQRALSLPPEAISYEGMGDTKPVAENKTEAGKAKNRRVEVQVWYDEITEQMVEQKVEVDKGLKRINVCRVETVCKLRYKVGHSRRTKLKNLIPPMHYDEASLSEIPSQFLNQLRQALHNLRGKDNVQMRFIAYTDNIPLEGREARIYGDHLGLSKARSRRVAVAVQEAMGLPANAVSSTGKGASAPVASNNSERGRALNRRIEVEFWHDDPLEDLPDEPQICPEAAAAETVERIYNPPEGDIKPIYFEKGKPVINPGYTSRLARAMNDIKDKGNVRLRFVGYTSNERLDRRTAMVYGDDIGLSTSRARRAMQTVQELMQLSEKQVEFEGRGYVQSHDVVNTGFLELDQSKVEVEVVYDELANLDDSDGLEIKRITRDVKTQNPYALNLMRISVDGQPLNDPNKNIPDVQRCTDVALEQSRIRFKFDNLEAKPRLNVAAWPNVISEIDNVDTELLENQVNFKLYSNYPFFFDKAEVRIFRPDQSTRATPVKVVSLNADGKGRWQFDLQYQAPRLELKYVLRVYNKDGLFDETSVQSLWVVDELETDISGANIDKELLVGYGGNRLEVNNIPINGGLVKVQGDTVPAGHKVWFAGYSVPVNEGGEFGSELILPRGMHTVEVSVTDDEGSGRVYLRELQLQKNDWFYVGIADITVSRDSTNGPAQLVTQDDAHYDDDWAVDGRFAFYAKGKLGEDWDMTASADTREGPIEDLFTNFMNKSPDALFRRIDPDYHYPTFGDDSTVEEDAPTSGKFYVKLQNNKNYGLWGNFDVDYLDNNLAHVDRSLYGANINYQTLATTTFGEERFAFNVFAAEPGTLAGRDEFRGTSGSLYFLRRQDVLQGSDRLRIEVRDGISGLVLGVKNLVPGLDYDIDYFQGRIMLTQPLSAQDVSVDTVVDSGDAGSRQVYLVARYEYTPGFEELDDVALGARTHWWLTDGIKLGLTADQQDAAGIESSLNAADITFRANAGTWLKLEAATSEGPVSESYLSNDGGFNFNQSAMLPGNNVKADAYRMDGSVNLEEVVSEAKGKLTFYHQTLEAGYTAPGLIAHTKTVQEGLTLHVPLFDVFNVRVKGDQKLQEDALETEAVELDVDWQATNHWLFSAGVRKDWRFDHSPVVPLTQEEGIRTDLAVKAEYDSREHWSAYTFAQDTVESNGNRDTNARVGVGGKYRTTDRFSINGELSGGDLGEAVKLGTDYRMTDTTNIYANYSLENERTDNGVRARQGKMASGFKTRYSDSASIYMEEKYSHGDIPTGLTHSMGFDLAPTDALNLGANVDVGTLKDNVTAAEINRTAVGFRIGYKFAIMTYAGALEFREDESEQPDGSFTTRSTWLTKNSFKYTVSPSWTFIGKFNHSESESSLGEFYDGNFTETVYGYAYRPVDHNTLNALFKYTYFFNVPATDQVTIENTAAEYIQKSHILVADVMFDISSKWALGGKLAHRMGELSRERVNPQFFRSDASLYVLRADYHFRHRWDGLLEARMLELPDAGDRRSGALIGVYRHMGEHFKFGVGYNFTDFSDDLTDLDYDSQGLFINLIGKW